MGEADCISVGQLPVQILSGIVFSAGCVGMAAEPWTLHGLGGEGSLRVRMSTKGCDPTRLETRTKESSTTASRRVWKTQRHSESEHLEILQIREVLRRCQSILPRAIVLGPERW